MSTRLISNRSARFISALAVAALLFLGSAPSWAANENRPAFGASSAFGELAFWWTSVIESGRLAVTAIWADYGIAIDPNGVPVDTSRPGGLVDPTDPALR